MTTEKSNYENKIFILDEYITHAATQSVDGVLELDENALLALRSEIKALSAEYTRLSKESQEGKLLFTDTERHSFVTLKSLLHENLLLRMERFLKEKITRRIRRIFGYALSVPVVSNLASCREVARDIMDRFASGKEITPECVSSAKCVSRIYVKARNMLTALYKECDILEDEISNLSSPFATFFAIVMLKRILSGYLYYTISTLNLLQLVASSAAYVLEKYKIRCVEQLTMASEWDLGFLVNRMCDVARTTLRPSLHFKNVRHPIMETRFLRRAHASSPTNEKILNMLNDLARACVLYHIDDENKEDDEDEKAKNMALCTFYNSLLSRIKRGPFVRNTTATDDGKHLDTSEVDVSVVDYSKAKGDIAELCRAHSDMSLSYTSMMDKHYFGIVQAKIRSRLKRLFNEYRIEKVVKRAFRQGSQERRRRRLLRRVSSIRTEGTIRREKEADRATSQDEYTALLRDLSRSLATYFLEFEEQGEQVPESYVSKSVADVVRTATSDSSGKSKIPGLSQKALRAIAKISERIIDSLKFRK